MMTMKSKMVDRDRAKCNECQSIILKPMTINKPANAEIGIQLSKGVNNKKASKDHTPCATPDKRVSPPLALLTRVAPIVPAPGVPPNMAAAKFPKPCAINSRFD